MTPVILFGGMMAGIMTPTEAAAVATVYALVLGLLVYREFDIRELPKLVVETVETTGMVLALVMTAAALAWCLSIARVPQLRDAAHRRQRRQSAALPLDRQTWCCCSSAASWKRWRQC